MAKMYLATYHRMPWKHVREHGRDQHGPRLGVQMPSADAEVVETHRWPCTACLVLLIRGGRGGLVCSLTRATLLFRDVHCRSDRLCRLWEAD